MKKVLVLDFGGQYNLLVARRVRECGVYCEIKSFRMTMDEVRAFAPDAIIFTGGPATVFDPGAPMIDPEMLSMGVPVLGICYGLQLMMHLLGGQCCKADTREYGKTELTHTASPLFDGVPETAVYWMSHGVEVERLAPGFEIIASTEGCRHAAVQCLEKKLYGVQFHPEVVHTEYGRQILENFLYKICGFRPEWTMASYLEEAVAQCREKIGNGRVLLALSGGVDSSVAAALLQRAVGRQLTCVFVDHGLLRKDEGDEVEACDDQAVGRGRPSGSTPRPGSSSKLDWRHGPRAQAEDHRRGVHPRVRGGSQEDRRGRLSRPGHDLPRRHRVRPGRMPPSSRATTTSAVCRTVSTFKEIIEPLRLPVQGRGAAARPRAGAAGIAGLAPALPRPGPCHPRHGRDHEEKLDTLRDADAIFREELAKAGDRNTMNQYFAVLTDTAHRRRHGR